MADNKQVVAEQALERYAQAYLEMKVYLDRLDELKEEAQQAVATYGESLETENCKATVKSPYTRTSWDSKGLDGYARLIDSRILDYKKETEVNPSPSIRVL